MSDDFKGPKVTGSFAPNEYAASRDMVKQLLAASFTPSFVIQSQVGKIIFGEDSLKFEGNVDESAKAFAEQAAAMMTAQHSELLHEANALAREMNFKGTVTNLNDLKDLLSLLRKVNKVKDDETIQIIK